MTRKTIPLRFCKSKIPLVTFRLADEEHYAIIDTGSEISILGAQLKDKIDTREMEAETSLVGVNGGSEYRNLVQGACYATFKTSDDENIEMVVGGMMSDLKAISSHFMTKNGEYIPIAVIIGGDFLKHYNAKIDYKKKHLTITV